MDIHNNKMVTASYDGVIIFWNVEVGLPISQFKLKNSFQLELVDRSSELIKRIKKQDLLNTSTFYNLLQYKAKNEKLAKVVTKAPLIDFCRSTESTSLSNLLENNNYHVNKAMYLKKRHFNLKTANLITAGALGWVRAWSCDINGHLLGQFNASHKVRDSIVTFCLDEDEMLLFTGVYIF